MIPVIIFKLSFAIIICIIWGLSLLCIFSFYLAKNQNAKSWKVVIEHLIIAVVVIILAYYVGHFIKLYFSY